MFGLSDKTIYFLSIDGLNIYLVVMALIEGVIKSRFQPYDWKSCAGSTANLALRCWVNALVSFSVSVPLARYLFRHRLFDLHMNAWWAWALLLLAHEFFHYWYHRATHRVRWFWIGHSVHHSPNDLTFAASSRAETFVNFTGVKVFLLPLAWLGFPAPASISVFSLSLAYQLWVHSTWIPKLGWLEYVLNTPSAHRVHHAKNAEYLDANYGRVLIIFDRLFGTYVAEREDLPCRYGLVKTQPSSNPLRFELEPWRDFFLDLASSRSPREFFGYWLGPPGWAPDGAGLTTEVIRRQTMLVPQPVPLETLTRR